MKYYFFDKESCDICGMCLSECPIFEFSIEKAKEEMKKIIKGEKSRILTECANCISCDRFCPKGCGPYKLILYRWCERYKKEGIPEAAGFLLPWQRKSWNMWPMIRDILPEDEKETVNSWGKLRKCEEIIYPGCNVLINAYLTFTKLFNSLTFMGSYDICCGEPIFRAGIFDIAEQIGRKLEKRFQDLGVKRVIFMCLAGLNLFENVYPKRFGLKFDFEKIALLDWLWKRIERGEIKIKTKLDKTFTVHDNCQAKSFGNHFYDLSRKILETSGADIVEMEHNRDRALCCGMAVGIAKFDVNDIIEAGQTRLREAESTGADAMVVYCAGCYWMLSMMKMLNGSDMPIYHIIEIVQMAAGEKPVHRIDERAQKILEIIGTELGDAIFKGDRTLLDSRYWVEL